MLFQIPIIIFEILLISFFVGSPLRKGRPIVIRSFLAALIILFCFSLIATLSGYIFLYVAGVFLAMVIYYIKLPWIVIGITQEQLKADYQKSLAMTRSPLEASLIFLAIFAKISIVRAPTQLGKKSKLVENLFRKLIENHTVFHSPKRS